jgi:3'-5' exoribonuclease
MFPEALVLHYLDDLDSKMEAMRAHFEREADSEGPWTTYNASLGRPLLDSEKFLRTEPAPEEPVAADSGAAAAEPASQTSDVEFPGLFTGQKA